MSLSALSKYIILFLFALVVVLGAAIGILSADNRALLKANAALKEQVAYRDMVISEVQNNIDALKAQAAAIEQSCAKRLKAREDVMTLFDIPEREPPPSPLSSGGKLQGEEANWEGLNGKNNEKSEIISKTKSDYSIDAINGYIVEMLTDIASGAISE